MAVRPPKVVKTGGAYRFAALLTCFAHARRVALADNSMTYVVSGDWLVDSPGEYQLNDVIVVYERTNDSVAELVSLRHTPVDLHVFVSTHAIARKYP